MSSAHLCPFKILWITLQMVLALIGPHPENASPHLHPYISKFQYVPQYHPARNPDCASQWLRRDSYNERFGHKDRRYFSFEEPLVDQDHPWIEIRAILVRCSKTRKEIETSRVQSIRNCRRKVIISMKMNNVGETNIREEFVLVDHILDPVNMHKIRLRNPYVIKVRQEPLLHLYGLRLQGVVNAEAREEVINNQRANFTGCNDGLNNPTCGQMLINGQPISFSQGFCCSCEDAQRAESFRSVAAKSNYYQRDDGANRARNRSASSANLFDKSEAQRQVETNRKEEHNRQVGSGGGVRGRVTSRNTSAVNDPLGEQASPLRKQQEEEQLKINSIRRRARPFEGFSWAENAKRTESLPPVLKNVFYDPSPSKKKIEAYIDAVYEQAMKERATKQAIKYEGDERSEDLLKENDRRISDGSSIYGPITDNLQDTTKKSTNIDCDSRNLKSRKFNPQFPDQSDDRSSIRGSVADDPRNPTAKLTKLGGERDFTKMAGKEDNRDILEPEKCDRSANFSESGNRKEMARDQFRGVAQPENTFDYTPTSLAIHSSRISEESQFSRRTEKNAFLNDDNALLEGSFPTTVKFFIRSGISFGNNIDESINYNVTSSTIRTKSNSFEENVLALLSKIVIDAETRSSTEDEGRRYGFRTTGNILDNVNALRYASFVSKNLSAAAIRRGNASGEERKTENANVSTQISAASALTRLRNLSSSVGISRLEELSAPTVAVAAAPRSGDKSLMKILESKTRSSLPTNEIQGFSDLGDLYKGRREFIQESRRMYNSAERAPKDVNLKNSYKFWKPRRKLRKSKGVEKFREDKDAEGNLKRYGKSRRGLTRKRASSDFKRDSFRNEFSKRERRFRRHLRTGKEVFNIADARSNVLTDEGSRRKTRAFTDHYARPEVTHSKRKKLTNVANESPKKQVILESGHSYRKVQSEENPFYFDNGDGKKNSVDKRIEDKFVRISNVLKEDSTETGIIQETAENFEVVTKSEVAKADIPKIRDELGDNLFSRENGKSDELLAIHDDEITHEQPAESNTRQRSTVKESSFATAGSTLASDEVTITSLITRQDPTDYKESVSFKPDPFPSSSITRKLDYNSAEKIDFNKSKNSICSTNKFAIRQTEIFTQELSSVTSPDKNGHFEITDGSLGTLSNNRASNSKKMTEILNGRSEGERDKTKNAKFLPNNNSSRFTADDFAEPEGSFIDPKLSSRGNASITETKEISLSDGEEIGSRYTQDPILETSGDFLRGSREKEEIAELVDRIVRQYAAYTPIMPSMPTFDDITEAETLPLEEETIVTRFTTTSATTTKITDVAFRPSIRPLQTTSLSGEMHDEISLDDTTFADETEATTTTRERTVSKPRFRPERPDVNISPKAKVRKVSSKSGKNGKRQQKITDRVTNVKMTNAEEEVEDHPWYQTTELQQIIAANQSKPVQKIKGRTKQHRYKKIDYFQNIPSARTSSTVFSGVAQTRGKRSDFIQRTAGNRDSSVFYESKDEEARRTGRTGLNKNEKSPNITEPTELRSTIEKRLVGELDYPASRGFSRHSCESQDQAQKLNAALQDIAARNAGLRTVEDNLGLDAQKKDQGMQGNLKNFTSLKLRHVKDGAVHKFDKDTSSRNRGATLMSPSDLAKIPLSRMDFSGSVRERLEIDRRSGRQMSDERMVAEIDRVAVMRKIAVSENVNASDLSDRGAELRARTSASGILPTRARSPEDRDKSRETDTVIRGVKLMMADDKGKTRELDVAAKSADKKIPPLLAARQQGREDARKINENPADCRVSAERRYLRRPRDKVYDTVREIINKIKGKLSSDKAGKKNLVRNEKRTGRSLPDWHRSGRRLLSSGGSGYIENIDDEYYDENEVENDSSDNEAKRDDLSYLENRSGLREDRDSRKLAAGTNRLTEHGNVDVARAMMPEERTVAAYDAAMHSDDMRNNEKTLSRNERKVKNTEGIKVAPESIDLASFNDDNVLDVPLKAEEKSIVQSTADNNKSVRERSFDNSENILRNSRSYNKRINEEPFSFREKINENNLLDETRDESLYETQPTFNTREIVNFPAINNLSNAGRILSNVDSTQSSAAPKNEGSIKISLIGRIQVHGGFNQTPMLISFDAIPDGSSTTHSSVSTELSNIIRVIETTINLSLNDPTTESAFDLLSTSERANDKASDSLSTILNDSQEVEKKSANEIRMKSREKLSDLMRRSGEERKTAKKNPLRIEKRLDKYNANSRTAKQVFLTDYSSEPNGKVNGTDVEGTVSERTGETIGKLDFRSSANPVYFPDILGSVLVNNDSLRDQEAIKGSTIETNRSNSIEIEPLNTTTLRIVPLVRIDIKKPRLDPANDERTDTTCCPQEDPRNATSGGCYRMPATVRKLEITEVTSRELQTSSNYRNDLTETFRPGFYETTVNDRNAVTMRSSPSARLQSDVSETATKCTTNEIHSTATVSNNCNDGSTTRVRNLMAIVRFMMKLLRIVVEDEEPSCPRTQIGETVIHVKDVVINASSHVQKSTIKNITDRTIIKSGRTGHDLTINERRSTITERMREESSPFSDSTFEFFTEAPSHPAAFTSSDEVSKGEGLSTLFETSTGKGVYTSTLSTSFATPKSFLFYEPARKSLRKGASRKNARVDLTGVKQNSNVSFKSSKDASERKKSRLDGGQTNRSSSRNLDGNCVDQLQFGKQGIASTANPEDKIGSSWEKYLTRSKNVGFSRTEPTGIASDTVRSILPRDIDVSRNALLERISAARENRPERSKSKKARQAGVSDRRAETRTKLLNRSTRGGPPGDWIGEHRATRRLPIDRKLRESCKVPGGTATLGKVVFRRVRGKINRPPDPNLVSGRSDSFKIEGNVAGNGPLAKLSTDDALFTVGGELSSPEREAAAGNAIRYSTSSLMNDNIDRSRIGRELVDEHTSIPYKKRDVSERRDFRKGNRVLRTRQKTSSPTRRKARQRRKKKRKKGSQRTRDISETENQRRFKRHLLMTSLESEYDANDNAARFSRRYVAVEKRNAEKFQKSAGNNARRRRKRDGSRMVDGSEADLGVAQIRGGQDCTDRRHPPNIDAAKYLESAHCLRFSDLWYSVYQLEDPIVEHAVYLQVYEKRALANGSTYWEDLTEDSVVRLGTFNRHHRGSQDTIAFAYKEVKMLGREEEIPNLDVVRDRLLVPSSVTSKGSEYPAEDKSDEYLVLPASSINESGNECDKAGVGFAAFARQPDRCGRVRGTCLKNQPLAYRRRDLEARAAGRSGCYFLSNFASVPSEPIKYSANGSGSHEFLALEYHSPHVSAIDIEVEAGYNAMLAGGSLGRISEVHVDSTALDHTVVTIVITNMGLTSMSYRSKIAKCPDNLPKSWMNATFPRKIIQSRRDQTMSLDLYGELPINEFHCSVQLLNRFGELVATRRIKIRKMDRCSCILYCLCVCMGDARGTRCRPMSPELYHVAGFRGPVPTASREIFAKTVDILFFIILSILLLLFTGFLKWLIGLYIPVIGRWGLDSLLETNGMSQYFERELKYKYVVTNEHGAPVHPDTRKRTIRICSRKAEFFLNTMFFLIFPFAICCLRLKKSFRRRPARRRCCPDESKISLTSDKSERPRTICVSTYGDSRDSRMEAEDTKYVMDELKKSEESLRSRTKSKVRNKRDE